MIPFPSKYEIVLFDKVNFGNQFRWKHFIKLFTCRSLHKFPSFVLFPLKND